MHMMSDKYHVRLYSRFNQSQTTNSNILNFHFSVIYGDVHLFFFQ